MRYHQSRKTLVPSKGQVHQGMIASVGRFVVLSVFMLVLGVTSTTGQTGQDERCAGYSGQAHSLCTAAVAEGCFDGVESQECEGLTTNWNLRCSDCLVRAPWAEGEYTCPCAGQAGSAVEINEIFEARAVFGGCSVLCHEDARMTHLWRIDGCSAGYASLMLSAGWTDWSMVVPYCDYRLYAPPGLTRVRFAVERGITLAELEACREDIRSLMEQIDCP